MNTRPLQWLSGEWIDVLEVVLKGAREREMTCDMIVGSGWPFGGEFLAREDQTQMVALGTREMTGPGRLEITRGELLADVSPALVSPQADALKELFSLALAPYELNKIDQVVNLNDRIAGGTDCPRNSGREACPLLLGEAHRLHGRDQRSSRRKRPRSQPSG